MVTRASRARLCPAPARGPQPCPALEVRSSRSAFKLNSGEAWTALLPSLSRRVQRGQRTERSTTPPKRRAQQCSASSEVSSSWCASQWILRAGTGGPHISDRAFAPSAALRSARSRSRTRSGAARRPRCPSACATARRVRPAHEHDLLRRRCTRRALGGLMLSPVFGSRLAMKSGDIASGMPSSQDTMFSFLTKTL